MRGTAQANLQPRLGSDDPFRPELHARVQNIRSNLLQGTSEVWRGHGSWSASAKHQRVTVKIRYRSDAAGAEAYAKYMTKDGKGLDGQKPEAWNQTEKGFDAPARVREWMKEGDERWFKIVFSPEKPFGDVEGMVTHSMTQAEVHMGTKLDWFAARHYDGGKDHVHVFLRGRDDQGNTLAIDKQYIKFGFRDSAQRYVTYHPKFGLGERSSQEIAAGKERAAEIRERRDQVRALVIEARKEGLLDWDQYKRLSGRIRNLSPSHLEEVRTDMRNKLDRVENVWRERSADRSADRSMGGVREPVTKDSVQQQIERAEREGKIDALDADRFRRALDRGALDQVSKEVNDALKVKTEAERNVGQSQDAERIKRRGGLSL